MKQDDDQLSELETLESGLTGWDRHLRMDEQFKNPGHMTVNAKKGQSRWLPVYDGGSGFAEGARQARKLTVPD